ncbi:hypothetical protein LCGC14_1196390 [marine sediment metagenome]|uniref:Integration host factor subunit beta n=1 Tax=marine sediment metagenome TaxID=412755 RepID=A0A0F9P0K6_9ZZZZ
MTATRTSKSTLADRIARVQGLPHGIVLAVVNQLFEELRSEMISGNLVGFRGFGSFQVRAYNTARGHFDKKPKFRASPSLRRACRDMPIESPEMVKSCGPDLSDRLADRPSRSRLPVLFD